MKALPAALPFVKMHGLGNDFVVIQSLKPGTYQYADLKALSPELAARISHRQFGVGCDQVLWLTPSKKQENAAEMQIFNSDGSRSEMCGNGIRAVAAFLQDHGPEKSKAQYRIETLGGLKEVEITGTGAARQMRVNMGIPKLGALLSLNALGKKISVQSVDMGNPHAVVFMQSENEFDVLKHGPMLEHDSAFPNRANIEFAYIKDRREIDLKVWERGAGATLACGTGACATAAAAIAAKKTENKISIHLPGGTLRLEWAGDDAPLFMEGPATYVFSGQYWIED